MEDVGEEFIDQRLNVHLKLGGVQGGVFQTLIKKLSDQRTRIVFERRANYNIQTCLCISFVALNSMFC